MIKLKRKPSDKKFKQHINFDVETLRRGKINLQYNKMNWGIMNSEAIYAAPKRRNREQRGEIVRYGRYYIARYVKTTDPTSKRKQKQPR